MLQLRIGIDERAGALARAGKQYVIGIGIEEAELGQAVLARAKKITHAAQPEISIQRNSWAPPWLDHCRPWALRSDPLCPCVL